MAKSRHGRPADAISIADRLRQIQESLGQASTPVTYQYGLDDTAARVDADEPGEAVVEDESVAEVIVSVPVDENTAARTVRTPEAIDNSDASDQAHESQETSRTGLAHRDNEEEPEPLEAAPLEGDQSDHAVVAPGAIAVTIRPNSMKSTNRRRLRSAKLRHTEDGCADSGSPGGCRSCLGGHLRCLGRAQDDEVAPAQTDPHAAIWVSGSESTMVGRFNPELELIVAVLKAGSESFTFFSRARTCLCVAATASARLMCESPNSVPRFQYRRVPS